MINNNTIYRTISFLYYSIADPVNFSLPVKNANSIQFKLSSLFNSGVQNLISGISSTILKWENALLVHTYMVVQRYREDNKPQAIIIYVEELASQSGHVRLPILFSSRPDLELRL